MTRSSFNTFVVEQTNKRVCMREQTAVIQIPLTLMSGVVRNV